MDIFASQELDPIDFGEGFVVYLRREMTAGIREDLKAAMARMAAKGATDLEVQAAFDHLAVELMTARIQTPSGDVPVTRETVRRLTIPVLHRLVQEVNARIPPLAPAPTGQPTTTSGA